MPTRRTRRKHTNAPTHRDKLSPQGFNREDAALATAKIAAIERPRSFPRIYLKVS